MRGETAEPEARQVEAEAYRRFQSACFERAQQQKKQQKRGGGMAGRLYTALNQTASGLLMEVITEQRFVTPCCAGRRMVVMDDEGTVQPCEMLGVLVRQGSVELSSSALGNIRQYDYDIRKLLAAPQAREVVATIARSRCFCTYECAMAANVLYSPRLLARALGGALKSGRER